MRRPLSWLHWVLILCLLLIGGEALAVIGLVPHYVMHVVESAVGGTLRVGGAHLSFPLTTTLQGVRAVNSTPEFALSIQGVVIRPRGVSIPSRMLELDALQIEQPLLRLTRSQAGTMLWPALLAAEAPAGAMAARSAVMAASPLPPRWRLHIDSIQIDDGTIELIDQKLPTPFHGVLQHVSVVAGPVTIPFESSQVSFAVRGELIGHAGEGAPLYCSGWVNFSAKDLQASCQLEPLALAAFEPYYQQKNVQVRVYSATLKSTSQWTAKANALEGRIQVELGHLTEGDLSVRGKTLVDVKKLAGGEEEPKLRGEFQVTGPLDNPGAWRPDFVPGDAAAQQLVQPLLDRGIEIINIPFGGRKIGLSITPANQETMTDIQEVSKQVEKDLEILSAPTSEATPPGAQAPRAPEPGTVPADATEAVAPSPAAVPASAPENVPQRSAPSELLPSPTPPPSGGS